MKYSSIIILLFILGIWVACEKVTSPKQEDLLYQIEGCNEGIAKVFTADSCFTYQFETDLVVDFCVTANCCPDSDRFNLSSQITQNTITITVQDTASDLCLCTCPYVVHAEFYSLQLDHYFIQCMYDGDIVYWEEVGRSG